MVLLSNAYYIIPNYFLPNHGKNWLESFLQPKLISETNFREEILQFAGHELLISALSNLKAALMIVYLFHHSDGEI